MSNKDKKSEAIKHLQTLRNIGPKMAEKLYALGIKTPEQMKKANPEKLFKRLHTIYPKVDLCELYVFRGAVLDIPWWECKNLGRKHKLISKNNK
ncbi:MAG: helix-hairpin-helix domain-containing protein [Nitrospirota bacterium]